MDVRLKLKLYCLSSSKSVRTALIAEANLMIQEGKDVSFCIDSECHDTDEASSSSSTNIVSKQLSIKAGLLSNYRQKPIEGYFWNQKY